MFGYLDENDFWPMLTILTEHINKNLDYYTSEPAGADFIMHLRSEIERTKSRANETWFIRDQHLSILIFYLKFALSGTAIPRNIMINADAMISQAGLKDTGTLLSGTNRMKAKKKQFRNVLSFFVLFRILSCRIIAFTRCSQHDISTTNRTNSSYDCST